MRKTLFLTLFSFLILTSCGGGASDQETAEDTQTEQLPEVLQKSTMDLDLSDYYLPFTLIVPDSNRGYPMVEETSYGETIVKVGSVYQMVVAEGGDLAAKKAELEGDLLYAHEIVEEGDDHILYKSSIKDSYLEPEFHFYAVKQIGNLTFEFRDYSDEGGHSESVAKFMLASVNHLKPKEKNEAS